MSFNNFTERCRCVPKDADVSGIIAEVKEENKTDYPMSECYRNMSTVGTALAIQGLLCCFSYAI